MLVPSLVVSAGLDSRREAEHVAAGASYGSGPPARGRSRHRRAPTPSITSRVPRSSSTASMPYLPPSVRRRSHYELSWRPRRMTAAGQRRRTRGCAPLSTPRGADRDHHGGAVSIRDVPRKRFVHDFTSRFRVTRVRRPGCVPGAQGEGRRVGGPAGRGAERTGHQITFGLVTGPRLRVELWSGHPPEFEGRYDSRPQPIGSDDGDDPNHLEGPHGSVRSQGAPLARDD